MNNNTEEEAWKAVNDEGFENMYEVSNLGRIRSVDRVIDSKRGPLNYKGKLISTPPNTDGYPSFNFCKAGKKKSARVHQVVAKAFIPNPENYPEVNHIDEVKSNNNVDNLEWCTRLYNMNYGTGLKRMKEHPNQIERHENSKVPIIGVRISDKKVIRFESIAEADRHGFKRRNLWSAINGYDKSHNGYVWCYEDDYSKSKVKSLLKSARLKRVAHVDESGKILKVFENQKEASLFIGVDSSQISRVCNGKAKSTKGYKLKFI